MQGYVYKIDQ